jgi:flagellar biogenesis protein FliO
MLQTFAVFLFICFAAYCLSRLISSGVVSGIWDAKKNIKLKENKDVEH